MKAETFHHGNLRAALIEAARAVMEETSSSDLSLRDLARRVGVSPMAAYRHFTDKEDLLRAVADLGFADLVQRMEAAQKTHAEPLARVAEMCRAYLAFAQGHPAMFDLMFAAPVLKRGLTPDNCTRAFGSLQSAVAACPAPGTDPGAVAAATIRLWSLVHGYSCLVLAGRLVESSTTPAFLDAVILPVIETLRWP
jgi:AcrR family transcriptional regulator